MTVQLDSIWISFYMRKIFFSFLSVHEKRFVSQAVATVLEKNGGNLNKLSVFMLGHWQFSYPDSLIRIWVHAFGKSWIRFGSRCRFLMTKNSIQIYSWMKNFKNAIFWFLGLFERDCLTRFRKYWRKLTDLGLNKGRGWFLNFSEAPLIFGWKKHLLSGKC